VFSEGLTLLTSNTPPLHRGGILSALFLVAYLIQCVVVLLIGKVATIAGLGLALELGSVTVAVLSLITMTMAALMRLSHNS
jgi:hypothetical protein